MKKGVLVFSALIVLSFLAACAEQSTEFSVQRFQPVDVIKDKPVRPLLNRTIVHPEPEPAEQDSRYEPDILTGEKAKQVPQLSTPVEEYRLKAGYGLVGLNQTLGRSAPPFTKYDFPELLKSRLVKGVYEPVTAQYEQVLKLLGGRVKFAGDEYENVQDFLSYRDGEPIFEYVFSLSQGTFLEFIESEIWLLGNKYVISEVNEQDVILTNSETGDQLVLGSGHAFLNKEPLTDTDTRMTGNQIFIVAEANSPVEGDIFVPEGESLQLHLGEPSMLTSKLDLRYMGLIDSPRNIFRFQNRGEEVYLVIDGFFSKLTIPLAYSQEEGFRLGDEEGILHVREGSSKTDFIVRPEEYFILTVPASTTFLRNRYMDNVTSSISTVLQLKDHNPREKRIELVSRDGFALEVWYFGVPGVNASGVIPFAGRSFQFHVDEDGSIAVDMNGDGRISGAIVDVAVGDALIDMPSQESFDGPANITLILMNFGAAGPVYGSGVREEKFTVQIIPEGDDFLLGIFNNLEKLPMQGNNDNEVSVSEFGTHYFLFGKEDDNEYEEIVVDHPLVERLAELVLESD